MAKKVSAKEYAAMVAKETEEYRRGRLPEIAKDYAPYDTLPAFREGFKAYGKTWSNPHEGVEAQAWDRGLECAARARRWEEQNVGRD